MAKNKFTLTASPTFDAIVAIPVPGKAAADVKFTFKHRDREAFRELMESLSEPREDRTDADLVLEVASGWDLEEPFDAEHVGKMIKNYIGSGSAILQAYVREQTGARQKN